MAETAAGAGKQTAEKTWFGHPRGLAVLFLTEMWERFSFYGMRALLIFYLTKHFLFSDTQSYAIYGAYTALVYLTPVLGGILADRYLGSRKAVTLGAILLVCGHFGMAFEGPPAVASVGEDGSETVARHPVFTQIFYFSLALIICGVGYLKANISTIVGALYEQGDPRRDGGFTIFYMGINIGAFTAAIVCGWLGETYGWAYGFGLAGLGMLAGLVIFLRGQHLLGNVADPPDQRALERPTAIGLSLENTIYAGTAGRSAAGMVPCTKPSVGRLPTGTVRNADVGRDLVRRVCAMHARRAGPPSSFDAAHLVFGSLLGVV